jgi:hypothetical protein
MKIKNIIILIGLLLITAPHYFLSAEMKKVPAIGIVLENLEKKLKAAGNNAEALHAIIDSEDFKNFSKSAHHVTEASKKAVPVMKLIDEKVLPVIETKEDLELLKTLFTNLKNKSSSKKARDYAEIILKKLEAKILTKEPTKGEPTKGEEPGKYGSSYF